MTYEFPFADYDDQNCAVFTLPIAFVPFLRRWFQLMQWRSSWSNRESWWRGYQVTAEIEEWLMSGCLQTLIDEQQRLYRLLDSSLNGTVYTADTDEFGEPIVTPELPPVPPTDFIAPGLRARIERLEHLLDNAYNGTVYSSDPQNPGSSALSNDESVRDLLLAVIDRLIEADPAGDSLLEEIRKLLV